MKGSLIIVGFFVLGTLCGVCHLLPFDIAETNISYYALCALKFFRVCGSLPTLNPTLNISAQSA